MNHVAFVSHAFGQCFGGRREVTETAREFLELLVGPEQSQSEKEGLKSSGRRDLGVRPPAIEWKMGRKPQIWEIGCTRKGVVLCERACFCLLSPSITPPPSKNPSKNLCLN